KDRPGLRDSRVRERPPVARAGPDEQRVRTDPAPARRRARGRHDREVRGRLPESAGLPGPDAGEPRGDEGAGDGGGRDDRPRREGTRPPGRAPPRAGRRDGGEEEGRPPEGGPRDEPHREEAPLREGTRGSDGPRSVCGPEPRDRRLDRVPGATAIVG